MPYLTEEFGNAASNHEFGVHINQKVKEARALVAKLIGCDTPEIIFTSGATEAINLGLKGLAEKNPDRKHIITVETEHKAVLDVCTYLEKQGCEVTYLPVQSDGLLDLEVLKQHLSVQTLVVAVMLVNNETGVIQPLKEIACIAHEHGAYVMSDGTQAVGKMPINVNELGIDLLAFSGHKFYGPKGVGGLFVRSRRPFRVKLESVIHGGGHERNMRSGTLNVPGIVGLGKAAEIAQKEMEKNAKTISALRDTLEQNVLQISDSFVNGHQQQRLYNTCNVCFRGVDADAIMIGLKDIMVSNGSACTSTEIKPSHVLMAMGLSEQDAYSSLRISLARFNTKSEVLTFCSDLSVVISNLRTMFT